MESPQPEKTELFLEKQELEFSTVYVSDHFGDIIPGAAFENPTSQAVQLSLVVCALPLAVMRPWQQSQLELPSEEVESWGQLEQLSGDKAASAKEYFPAPQILQRLDAVDEEYVPTEQFKQGDDPAKLV